MSTHILMYFLCSLLTTHADLSQYDQRQMGDVNVQVDLKDVNIFAFLKGEKEEYVDYDYAYDYSELTIKPQNRTTPKPFKSTSASTQQIDTENNSTIATTTVPSERTTAAVNNELTTSDFIATTVLTNRETTTTVRNYPVGTLTTEKVKNLSTAAAPLQSTTRKNCRKGFVLNKKGQCQLKINTTENALLRLVKLSQKLKSRRENKSNDNS